ncbi:hypothetical protein CEE44_04650 [Candidatus Woesearchaeota archaeon B3_Woes]|nr:MAG: hypothetical protein CEE44_04650 [Candidatus Woesearchaeota archaeon B3_Woes]
MIEAVLFDNDGTLVDSEPMYFQAAKQIFNPLLPDGVEISKAEYIQRWMLDQTGSRKLIKDYNLDVNVEDVLRAKTALCIRLIQERLQIMPGAQQLIERFYGDYPLALVSSSQREEVIAKISKFDLLKYFEIVLGEEDVERKKPYPDLWLKACEEIGVDPQNTIAIEDNPSGAISAVRAGIGKVFVHPSGFIEEKMEFPKNALLLIVLMKLPLSFEKQPILFFKMN